jgi:beta-glucanase (GH16 family)
MNTSVGPNCAFWLQSPENGATLDPAKDGVEIDIFEYHRAAETENIYFNLHWNGYGVQHKTIGSKAAIPGISNGFHLFALEWTPTEYIVYVDGVEKARTSTALSHRPEFLVLSMEINGYGGDHLKGTYPDYFEVDYVKVYALKQP